MYTLAQCESSREVVGRRISLRPISWLTVMVGLLATSQGCGAKQYPTCVSEACVCTAQEGLAVYYSDRFQGKETASGERYDARKMTAAHRTLPFGTIVEVSRVPDGPSVTVRINDRGPWDDPARIIDVSKAAARKLGMLREGVVPVRIRVVNLPAVK